MSEKSIELGHHLLTQDSFHLDDNNTLIKIHSQTPGNNSYELMHKSNVVGQIDLTLDAAAKRVLFDLLIYEEGKNLGNSTLQKLATVLDGADLDLVTADIQPDSRPYWEHLASKGIVIPLEPENPQTRYRVLPIQKGQKA